jgi:hypothetical protein
VFIASNYAILYDAVELGFLLAVGTFHLDTPGIGVASLKGAKPLTHW